MNSAWRAFIGASMLLFGGCSNLSDDEKTREGIFGAVLAADLMQTISAANAGGAADINPLIRGAHAAAGPVGVVGFFAAGFAAHVAITNEIEDKDMKALWQWGWIAIEVAFVIGNLLIGIPILPFL